MSEWRKTTTAELLQQGLIEIGDGYRAKNAEFVEQGGLPFVRVGDVGTTIRVDGLDELPGERTEKYGPKVSQPEDSLITMKGTVGRVAYVSADHRTFVYSPQISYWRSRDKEQVRPRWLRYWLESPEFRGQALATKGATDMADYINLRDQRKMRITVPPPPAQASIAGILGALDDLIENNRRRIKLLEEMAQTIYREWFVHFRYPGHEGVPLVDSPLGLIPKGWRARDLGQVVELRYGKALKKDGRHGGPVAVLGSSGVVGWHDQMLISGPSIIVGRKGNVGSVTWVDGPSWPIDTTYYVVTNLPLRYVVEQLRRTQFLNTHAAVPGLSRDQAYSRPFVHPPDEVMVSFSVLSDGLASQAAALGTQSERLQVIRGLLLPKLVTGEIDVSALDLDALQESVA